LNLFLQSNKPIGKLGEALQSGNSAVATEMALNFVAEQENIDMEESEDNANDK
jgi:hypothetical protein